MTQKLCMCCAGLMGQWLRGDGSVRLGSQRRIEALCNHTPLVECNYRCLCDLKSCDLALICRNSCAMHMPMREYLRSYVISMNGDVDEQVTTAGGQGGRGGGDGDSNTTQGRGE